MIMIMSTRIGEIVYVPNGQGGYNVFALPMCRAVYSCSVQEALEAVRYFLNTGVALNVFYQHN
jgi:hypothetical protein